MNRFKMTVSIQGILLILSALSIPLSAAPAGKRTGPGPFTIKVEIEGAMGTFSFSTDMAMPSRIGCSTRVGRAAGRSPR
jgi:hypothetical protein